MTAKLTPWFPGDVKPVRPGVYLRELGGEPYYSRWDGFSWKFSQKTIRMAAREKQTSLNQGTPWRGLAKEPK